MTSPQAAPPTERITNNKAFKIVMILCWMAVFFDGLDMFMYGATIPHMTADSAFGMNSSHAGNIGSLATFGMLVGALCAGMLTDAIGRRWGLIICTVVFTSASAVCALAADPTLFGIGRTVAGVGLGGLLPTAMTMVSEFAPSARRNLSIGILMTAHHAGGIAASLGGISIVEHWGWRSIYWVGVAPLIILVPLVLLYMPESLTYLVAKGKIDQARQMATKYDIVVPLHQTPKEKVSLSESLGRLFRGRNATITLLFWLASFGGLLLVYGFSTWLPQLMRAQGYNLGSSLAFLMVTNLGGMVGMLVAGRTSDKFGPVRVSMLWFFATAIGVFLLGVKMPLPLTYIVVFLAGLFLFSAQTMIYAAVAHVFPTESRASAIGWTTGMGRFGAVFGPWMGGQLFAMGKETWGFAAFTVAALFSVAMLLIVQGVLKATGGRTVEAAAVQNATILDK